MTATDLPGLAELEQERDFLIRSLRDLEAEHDAGDLDPADYQHLKDEYTARTAAVLRAIGAAAAPTPSNQPVGGPGRGRRAMAAAPTATGAAGAPLMAGRRRRRRTAAVGTVIVAFAVVAAWTVTQSSGSRLPGQSASGDNRALSSSTTKGSAAPAAAGAAAAPAPGSVDARLVSAAQLVNQGKVAEALQMYDEILKDNPNQPVALANDGWLLAQAGLAGAGANLIDSGLAKITQSEKIDATYPAVHFFRGFLLLRAKNDPAGAVTEFRSYLGSVDPSSPEVPQVEQLLAAAIQAAGPSVPAGPNAPTTTTTHP